MLACCPVPKKAVPRCKHVGVGLSSRVPCRLLLCALPRVRRAIKGVRRQQDLEGELPHCAIGALLALWVTQVGRGSS